MSLPARADELRKGLTATHQRMRASAGSDGAMYLRLPKSGEWIYGPDEMPVQPGAQWAVDPSRFMVGYISWETDENKPAAKLGEVMVPATDPPVDISKLPDTGCPWVEQMAMTLLCLNGEDEGTALIYNTTSKGGLRALNGVLGAVADKLGEGEGDEIIPVIELEVDSYQHKRYGKIYTPVFKLLRWARMSSTPATEATEVEPGANPPVDDVEAEERAEAPAKPTPQRTRRRRAPVEA